MTNRKTIETAGIYARVSTTASLPSAATINRRRGARRESAAPELASPGSVLITMSQMTNRLTKKLLMTAGDGTKPMNTWLPCVYVVEGLGNDRFTLISEEGDGNWAVIEWIAGQRTQIGGHYPSADVALEALDSSLQDKTHSGAESRLR